MTDYDHLIKRPSRYNADKSNWFIFAPDGAFEHDTLADQIDAFVAGWNEVWVSSDEAAAAIFAMFANEVELPQKVKGDE